MTEIELIEDMTPKQVLSQVLENRDPFSGVDKLAASLVFASGSENDRNALLHGACPGWAHEKAYRLIQGRVRC